MSKQQQVDLDAFLRQGGLDLEADVDALRSGFEQVMAQVPVPEDVEQRPVTIGGVDGIEVVVGGVDDGRGRRLPPRRGLRHRLGRDP